MKTTIMTMTALVLSTALLLGVTGCGEDATEVGEKCTEVNLREVCPPGSTGSLDAAATSQCDGMADGSFITQDASVTGTCMGTGECSVVCQFATPCDCGVDRVTDEGVFCTPCAAVSCTPSEERCDGDRRQVCSTNGDRWEPFACAAGQTCVENGGQAMCVDPDSAQCTAGMTRCDGDTLETCNGTGDTWEVTPCQTDLVCRAGTGTAQCADPNEGLCVPNATQCAGTSLERCNAAGSSWDREDCPGAEQCTNAGGTAVCANPNAGTCTPNEVRCEMGFENYIETCNADGTEWVSTRCGGDNSDDECRVINGVTRCSECEPNTSQCSEDDLAIENCDSDGNIERAQCGFGVMEAKTCWEDDQISLGMGCYECDVDRWFGERLCASGTVWTCTMNGDWEDTGDDC